MKNKIGIISAILEGCVLFVLLNICQLPSITILRIEILYLLIQFILGHYSVNTLLIWDEMNLLIKTHLCFLVMMLVYLPYQRNIISEIVQVVGITGIMFIFSIILQRYLHIWFRKSCAERILIIGNETSAKEVAEVCNTNRFALKDIKGYVSLDDILFESDDHKPVYHLDMMNQAIQNLSINSVIITAPNIHKKELRSLLNKIKNVDKISYMPLIDGINFDSRIDDFDGKLLVTTSKGKISVWQKIIKRSFDILAGFAGCLLLIPLTLYVYISNRKEGDKDPIFFVQERIGKDGKLFKMYKYRSMVPNAEQVLEDLMEKDSAIREEYLKNKKLVNDPRITKAGKFLREKSFDEFPQFINLLKGDMSLIGPRPYLPREKEDMGSYYQYIIGSKPGITGMWQTHGRSDTSFEERLVLDEYYQRNWSLKLDMTIVIRTFKTLFEGEGAR